MTNFGLRAIAVSAVVLFHLKLTAAYGGFVGVDVFFVISGYLITRIILRDANAGEFSFAQFYVRRTRRIFPALIFTVTATYIAGALWCSPLMFLDLAKECTHALLSIANIQYWHESHKYFAPNSDQLALMHCWSLSAEEQFYLVWPAFIILAKRFNRTRQAVALATLGSLIGSIAMARFDSSAVFFLTPFRIYEFGCGASILFFENHPVNRLLNNALSAFGLVAIIGSAALFRSTMPHLEIALLVPCLGASAVIFAGSDTFPAKLITNPIFIALGSISYSLYLCHWPIIFFARFIFGEAANSILATAMILIAMLATSIVMFVLIERPFIYSPSISKISLRRTAIQFWSIIALLVAVTHATFLSRGFQWRFSLEQKRLARLQDFPDAVDMVHLEGPASVYLVGDSHAVQYDVGLSVLLKQLHSNMEILASPNCPILYGVTLKKGPFRESCKVFRDEALEQIGTSKLPIIFDQYWSYYDDATIDYEPTSGDDPGSESKGSYAKLNAALQRTIEAFVGNGRKILLIGAQVDADCHFDRARLLQGPLPHAPLPPCPAGSRNQAEKSGARMNEMLAILQAKWSTNVILLRPIDYLCDSNCPTMKDGLWLYFDGTHFSVAGSRYMVARATAPLVLFLKPN